MINAGGVVHTVDDHARMYTSWLRRDGIASTLYGSRDAVILAKQQMHRIAEHIRRHRLQEPVSQVAWLASVGAFARWTQTHFHAPAGGVPWIGMTIRTTTFAIWGQVAREWMALRWSHRAEQRSNLEDS